MLSLFPSCRFRSSGRPRGSVDFASQLSAVVRALSDSDSMTYPVRHSVLCDLGGAMGGPAKQFLANRAKDLSLPHGLLAVQKLSESITYPAEVVAKGEAWAIDPCHGSREDEGVWGCFGGVLWYQSRRCVPVGVIPSSR